ncbi:hypothetical protein [Blastomonas sp. CACIA14H2]|uniref:hypothetical protein n=1 Tax=Blastomonas sp. CACIA14H2 TaxID=1419876 RepID=UPI0040597DA9
MSGVRQDPRPVASTRVADETPAPGAVTADPGRCRAVSKANDACAAFWEERRRLFFRQERRQP